MEALKNYEELTWQELLSMPAEELRTTSKFLPSLYLGRAMEQLAHAREAYDAMRASKLEAEQRRLHKLYAGHLNRAQMFFKQSQEVEQDQLKRVMREEKKHGLTSKATNELFYGSQPIIRMHEMYKSTGERRSLGTSASLVDDEK